MVIKRNAILKQLAEQLPFDYNLPWSELDKEIQKQILYVTGSRQFSFKLKGGKSRPETMQFGGVIDDLELTQRTTTSTK